MAVLWVVLLGSLHVAAGVSPPRALDNAVGYSRIVVATPGMRRYTYDISHDPQGRDFSIDFAPLDMTNFLPEPEVRFLPAATPRYSYPVNDDEEIQLNIMHPTHEEMEKSSRAIQSVHAAYSKKPAQPQPHMLENFDLGIMGYGDFMDSHDQSPPHTLGSARATPSTFKKPAYPSLVPQRGLVEKVKGPPVKFNAPLNFQRALFMPNFDEGRLNGLADKAYSKVFMAHGYSKPVPRFYSKYKERKEGVDMAKTLFVPVVLVPETQQRLTDKLDVDRSFSAVFEPRKIVKKP